MGNAGRLLLTEVASHIELYIQFILPRFGITDQIFNTDCVNNMQFLNRRGRTTFPQSLNDSIVGKSIGVIQKIVRVLFSLFFFKSFK